MAWFHNGIFIRIETINICHFSNHLLNVCQCKTSARFPFLFLPHIFVCTHKKWIESTAFISTDCEIRKNKKCTLTGSEWEGVEKKCDDDKPFGNDEFVGRFSFLEFIFFHFLFGVALCCHFLNARQISSGKSKFVQSKMVMLNINIGFQGIRKREQLYLSALKHCLCILYI